MSTETELLDLVRERPHGVLATIKRDGRPQLSTVNHAVYPDERVLRVSTTAGLAKVANLRRDARASYHVCSADGWRYAVAEGYARLSPVAQRTEDDTVEELVRLYRDVAGEHPDWAEYRAAMVADRRLVLRLHLDRLYGRA